MPADWRPPRQERTLHYEIERLAKRVYTIKLFRRFGGIRAKVFLRQTVYGNWEEAKRQAAVLFELQEMKDG